MIRKLIVLLALAAVVVPTLAGCATAPAPEPFPMAAEEDLAPHIHGAPDKVREAYRFAVANPEETAKYPCYCGCGPMGHTSNLSCYVLDRRPDGRVVYDSHALGCGICVDITQDVMRMLREGRSSPEIRVYVDARYGAFGPPTNTAFPTE